MGGIPYGKLQEVFSGEFFLGPTVLVGPSNGLRWFFRDRYEEGEATKNDGFSFFHETGLLNW